MTSSKTEKIHPTNSSTELANDSMEGSFGNENEERQTGQGPPNWIYAPIAVGVVLIIVFVVVVIVVRKRKRKAEDVSWLVGFENPQFRELNEKENKETFIDTGPSVTQNFYHTAT